MMECSKAVLFTWKCIFELRLLELVSWTLALVPVKTTTNYRRYFERNCKHYLYHRTYMASSKNATNMSLPNPNLVRQRDWNQLHLPMSNLPTFYSCLADILVVQCFANAVRIRSRDSLRVVVMVLHHQGFP